MPLIKIEQFNNGGHANQNLIPKEIPEGWAIIPDDLECENFPFGNITVELIDNAPTVITWEPLPVPTVDPIIQEPTIQDDTEAMLIDHEYRLALLELGVE